MENERNTPDYPEHGIVSLNKARNHFWYLHRNRIIRDLIEEYQNGKSTKRRPNVLELGAASGNISSYLSSMGYRVVASDFYRSAVDLLKRNGIKGFQYDLVDNAPVYKEYQNAYDFLILGDVIEHLDDPVMALKNAKGFLKKEGAIIITVPALSILWTKYDISTGHKRRYSIEMLDEDISAAGYSSIKTRYFMFLPAIILIIMRQIKNIFTRYSQKSVDKELDLNHVTNIFLSMLMDLEYKFQKLVYFPFGSSIYCIARVKNEN